MIRLLRIVGFLLIATGLLVMLTWAIEPLRAIWPWLMALPLAIRLGIGIAVFGFLLLMGSLIWERGEAKRTEGNLLDEEL